MDRVGLRSCRGVLGACAARLHESHGPKRGAPSIIVAVGHHPRDRRAFPAPKLPVTRAFGLHGGLWRCGADGGCAGVPAPYRVSPLPANVGQVLVVERPSAGCALADFLLQNLPDRHRLDVRHQIEAGLVRVNGQTSSSSQALRFGDVVELLGSLPPQRPQAGAAALPQVLFESASALVVDKPPRLPTVPDRAGDHGIHGLLAALRPGADLRIVHRLDRDTSGCLVLAKGIEAARHFDRLFTGGEVRKTYVALVHGVPQQAEFSIDACLGPDRRRPGKVMASASMRPGFRAACTRVVVRTSFARQALLELHPETGRGHQLRVHLQSVGHPIVGDADYGGQPLLLSQVKPGYKRRAGGTERPLVARMFLHAASIEFDDLDGTAVRVDAELPEDLALALRQLANYDEPRRPLCD